MKLPLYTTMGYGIYEFVTSPHQRNTAAPVGELLCFKLVNVKFLPLFSHEWVLAEDLLHYSDPHVTLAVARQVEMVASGLSPALAQQVGMLRDISFVLLETRQYTIFLVLQSAATLISAL